MTALVTGASSGIGKSICRMLGENGYTVFGFGRTFPEDMKDTQTFHPIVCDLLDTQDMLSRADRIRKASGIDLLVHCAGCAWYGLHEEIGPEKIRQMVRVNLEAPMILTQHLLRELKSRQGSIVFVSSVTASHPSPRGAVYGATKAALSAFAASLLAENRKYGLKVLTLEPDLTRTQLYRNADFQPSSEPGACLDPEDVASALRFALQQDSQILTSLIRIEPRRPAIARNRPST